jgi:hypothetical protein
MFWLELGGLRRDKCGKRLRCPQQKILYGSPVQEPKKGHALTYNKGIDLWVDFETRRGWRVRRGWISKVDGIMWSIEGSKGK